MRLGRNYQSRRATNIKRETPQSKDRERRSLAPIIDGFRAQVAGRLEVTYINGEIDVYNLFDMEKVLRERLDSVIRLLVGPRRRQFLRYKLEDKLDLDCDLGNVEETNVEEDDLTIDLMELCLDMKGVTFTNALREEGPRIFRDTMDLALYNEYVDDIETTVGSVRARHCVEKWFKHSYIASKRQKCSDVKLLYRFPLKYKAIKKTIDYLDTLAIKNSENNR